MQGDGSKTVRPQEKYTRTLNGTTTNHEAKTNARPRIKNKNQQEFKLDKKGGISRNNELTRVPTTKGFKNRQGTRHPRAMDLWGKPKWDSGY